MPLFPERGPIPEIQERPDEISPLTIEHKEVVTPTPVQFVKQVKSDSGQPLIQTPANQGMKITIPADPAVLTTYAKGSVSESITWLAAYWVRLVKKALHFGWQIVLGGQK